MNNCPLYQAEARRNNIIMELPVLPAELIDHVFAALLDVIGPVKALRLRVVNRKFKSTLPVHRIANSNNRIFQRHYPACCD